MKKIFQTHVNKLYSLNFLSETMENFPENMISFLYENKPFKHIIKLQINWTNIMCSEKVSEIQENFPHQVNLFFDEKPVLNKY